MLFCMVESLSNQPVGVISVTRQLCVATVQRRPIPENTNRVTNAKRLTVHGHDAKHISVSAASDLVLSVASECELLSSFFCMRVPRLPAVAWMWARISRLEHASAI
jgi:hypothetical protein